MLTHPNTPAFTRSIADRIRVTHRDRIEGGSPVVTRVSVILLDGCEAYTIHGEIWGDDLQVFSRGVALTNSLPVHIDSHDGACAWAVRELERDLARWSVAS